VKTQDWRSCWLEGVREGHVALNVLVKSNVHVSSRIGGDVVHAVLLCKCIVKCMV
jgi:hypothetical protein